MLLLVLLLVLLPVSYDLGKIKEAGGAAMRIWIVGPQ